MLYNFFSYVVCREHTLCYLFFVRLSTQQFFSSHLMWTYRQESQYTWLWTSQHSSQTHQLTSVYQACTIYPQRGVFWNFCSIYSMNLWLDYQIIAVAFSLGQTWWTVRILPVTGEGDWSEEVLHFHTPCVFVVMRHVSRLTAQFKMCTSKIVVTYWRAASVGVQVCFSLYMPFDSSSRSRFVMVAWSNHFVSCSLINPLCPGNSIVAVLWFIVAPWPLFYVACLLVSSEDNWLMLLLLLRKE